jgi:S-phase kinase-associated protein 1
MSDIITLRSSDDVLITVSKKAVQLSVTIKELLEDLGDSVGDDVPVRVKSETLKKVVEWMEYRKNDFDNVVPPANEEDRTLPELDEWDNKFCDSLDDDAKVEMILAANLLDIKTLLDIVAIAVANLVKGQSPEELRKVLQRTNKPIPEDLTAGFPGIQKMDKSEYLQEDLGQAFGAGGTKRQGD